ncbi:MAG: glutamine synthetase beta-grasp domain-containing protein [Candidatus Andersenbacteria bacterium]
MAKIQIEYLWIDGAKPYAKLRSKTKIVDPATITAGEGHINLAGIPAWGFDGSSTSQATTKDSDRMLTPVALFPDPIRGDDNLIVLCEVCYFDGKPHESNTRRKLATLAGKHQLTLRPLVGFEQELILMHENRPLRWPSVGAPVREQGPYYCGVGFDEVYGQQVKELHVKYCLGAGLEICGTNAEVMPGQWEFQIGAAEPLVCADHLWVGRYLFYKAAEHFGIHATLDPKPYTNWNGSGLHTNFSTEPMRTEGGRAVIDQAIERLSQRHVEHMQVYGADNEKRLTGEHETSRYDKFTSAVGHRGVSVRIPQQVAEAGRGYFEDRRPAASADPNEILTAMLTTVCGE